MRYGVEVLRKWKTLAETNAAQELERSRPRTVDDSTDSSNRVPSIEPNIDWGNYASKVRQINKVPHYVPQKVRLANHVLSVQKALDLQPCLCILGPAGAGKTATLRHAQMDMLDHIPRRIPVWVPLDLYEPGIGLSGLVQQGLGQHGLQLTKADVTLLMTSTEVQLMMDGWTEVSPSHSDNLKKEFLRWRSEYPLHRYVISGRRNEIAGPLDDASVGFAGLSNAYLQPFDDADLARYLSETLGFEVGLERLPPRLKQAAQWPLYAKMVAQLWKEKGGVDASCVAELVEKVLTRELAKGIGTLPRSLRDEIDEFMTELAASTHRQLRIAVSRSDARESIRKKWLGLRASGRLATDEETTLRAVFENPLICSEGNVIRFAHQIFQEFFAGRWLAERLKSEPETHVSLVSDPWWTYPVVFAAAQASDIDSISAMIMQSGNIWAIGRCLAGDAGDRPRAYCRTMTNLLLEKDAANRRLAVRCLIETVDDPWAFERLMKVITDEENATGNRELILTKITDTVLYEALRPFMMIDHRLTKLPLKLFSRLEGLSSAARWAVAESLGLMATTRRYGGNWDLLLDLLLKACKDPSHKVRSAAIDGLGILVYNEKNSASGDVPAAAINALRESSSSGHLPESQIAFEYLLRIGEAAVDEGWMRTVAINTIQEAEAFLASGETEFGAELAVDYFDEVIGPAIREAIDSLGNKTFERIMLLALPTASPMHKEDILWHLSRVGTDESVLALIEVVTTIPSAESAWEHRLRLHAANALVCVGTKKATDAILELARSDRWDVRLLGVMALLRSSKPASELKPENYKTQIAQCWLEAGGEMLQFMSHLGGGLLYTPETGNSFDSDAVTIRPVIDSIIGQLPVVELLSAARDMLVKGIEVEFVCRIFGDLGTVENLPWLHRKLNDPAIHDDVKCAIERIQERTN